MHDPGRSLRIAFVDANLHAFYGAQRRLIVLASGLCSVHDVNLVTTGEGVLADRAAQSGLHVTVLPASAHVNRFGGAVLASRGTDRLATIASTVAWSFRFAAWLRRRRIDVVVANDVRSCLMAGFGARLARRPLVWSLRDDVRAGRWHGYAAILADRVVAVSDGVQQVFTDAERRTLGRRLVTVYNGVPVAEPRNDARTWLRRTVLPSSSDNKLVIALVAMLTPRKGHADAVRAVAALRQRHGFDVALLIVGDAPQGYETYRTEVDALAERLGVADALHWTGYRTDAIDLMAGADVVVLPSSNEGLPGVLVEALGVGVPAIAYASSGANEIVRDGITGSIVPMGDVGALEGALTFWLRDRAARTAAGRIGSEDVRRRFSVSAYVRAYDELLHAVVERRPPHGG